MTDWADLKANISGTRLVRHAVLTFAGTWGIPGTQYPANVVSGLAEFVDDTLCFEVAVPGPYEFGPLPPDPLNAPSYQQSVQDAVDWTAGWLAANPNQTFALGGYSLGGEAASRVLIELQSGSLQHHMSQFIGGYTFGNPCRMAGAHAATIADPGGHGISTINMTSLPTIDGQIVWADYVHSKANGDAALDMYASVPNGQVGKDMSDVYALATNLQLNNLAAFTQGIVGQLTSIANDLFPAPTVQDTASQTAWGQLLTDLAPTLTGSSPASWTTAISDIPGIIATLPPPNTGPTGLTAALDASIAGIKFLAAPGGPTAPHISYGSEIAGYSNLVAQAVGFLQHIATLTPARSA